MEQYANVGTTTVARGILTPSDSTDTQGKGSPKEQGREARQEKQRATPAGAQATSREIALTKDKAKEERAREREDSKELATSAESLENRQGSAPNKGAKGKAKGKGKRREKDEYGK